MALDDRFESLGWVLELAKHGKLDITVAHNVGVAFIAALTVRRASLLLEARLVKVDFLGHDDSLCGHQYLEDGADL